MRSCHRVASSQKSEQVRQRPAHSDIFHARSRTAARPISSSPRRLGTTAMATMHVQAAVSALYGPDREEAARANTFLMEFTEQPVNTARHRLHCPPGLVDHSWTQSHDITRRFGPEVVARYPAASQCCCVSRRTLCQHKAGARLSDVATCIGLATCHYIARIAFHLTVSLG